MRWSPNLKLKFHCVTSGQRGKLGKGDRAVEAYVLESVSIENAQLREGQPYYVNVMLYKVAQ